MKNAAGLKTSKIFFPNLDGLRTVAFLMVFIQHGFWNTFQRLDIRSGFINKFIFGLTSGGNGVSLFFVLSGFLITYIIISEVELKQSLNVKYFYIRRVLRIWPLYYAVLLFAFIVYPFLKSMIGVHSNLASRPAFYFTFLSNFDVINIQTLHKGMDSSIEGITWSVAVEEQFYLIWPLLFYIFPKRQYKWIFPLVIIASLTFRYINRDDNNILYFHSLSVCADLAVGGLMAYFAIYSGRFRQFFSRLPSGAIILAYVAGVFWILYGDIFLNATTNPLFSRLVATFFFAFIILEQNYSSHSFYKFSQSKALTFWGKYTYGLYLLHPIALLLIDILLRLLHVTYKDSFAPAFAAGLAGLGLSLLMSYFSYELFEKRFLQMKERFSEIKTSSTSAGTSQENGKILPVTERA